MLKNIQRIKGLAPISTNVSGKLSAKARGSEAMKKWKEKGYEEEISASIPGLIKKTPWSHMIDRMKYNVLPDSNKLTMPVLLIVGTKDRILPSNQLLYDKLPEPKEIHTIKDAPHTFITDDQLQQVQELMEKWIFKYL